MTIETKVRKIGNSYGIILPKEALQKLNVSEGSPLYITETQDTAVRISSKDPSFAEASSMIDDIIQRYPNTLSELAK